MFSKVDYVMVNVSDMPRSVAFYRDTLGLRLKFESPGWSEFETGTTTARRCMPPLRAAGSEAAPTDRAVGRHVFDRLLRARHREHLCGVAEARSTLRDAAN